MNKIISIVIAVLILLGAFYYTQRNSTGTVGDSQKKSNSVAVENSEIKNGIQYVTLNARAGYSPQASIAKAGMSTKLIVKTDGTYDCSSTIIIRSLNYRNTLPNTGETEIAVGVPKKGDILSGTCVMGMYNFSIQFN